MVGLGLGEAKGPSQTAPGRRQYRQHRNEEFCLFPPCISQGKMVQTGQDAYFPSVLNVF